MERVVAVFLSYYVSWIDPLRAIVGVVIALVVIFGMMSFAAAEEFAIPLIQDKRASDFTVEFANAKTVFEIVLVPHPCDPDSNLLFAPDDPIVQCAQADEELIEYIEQVSIDVIGFPISIDDLLFPEVTTLNEIEQQIIQFDETSELIFERESNDLTQSTSDDTVIEQYQTVKDAWGEELEQLEAEAEIIFAQNPGILSKNLKQEIEKLKIKFDLKEEKIKNSVSVQKKIKTAIELKSLKEEFQDSMNEYAVTEKVMKYGDEKDKKLEQLIKQNTKLMKKMLIAEAKHNDKKLEFDDFKKIHEIVAEEIQNTVSNSGSSNIDSIIGNDDSISENSSESSNSDSGSDNSGKGSDKGKGSGNKGKGSDKGKSSDNNGKGKSKK